MNNAQRFCFEQEMQSVRGETTGCVVSVFTDHPVSVRVGLFQSATCGQFLKLLFHWTAIPLRFEILVKMTRIVAETENAQ